MIILDFKYPNSKKLYLTVEISQLLYKYHCNYTESKQILKLICDEIKQQYEDLECNDNDIIQPMNHIEPYC